MPGLKYLNQYVIQTINGAFLINAHTALEALAQYEENWYMLDDDMDKHPVQITRVRGSDSSIPDRGPI
jgi:hypothetical protein